MKKACVDTPTENLFCIIMFESDVSEAMLYVYVFN